MYVHVDGALVPASEAKVSVFDAGFQSGDAVWEGLRVYNGTVLRLEDHLTRLEHSAKALRITLPAAVRTSPVPCARRWRRTTSPMTRMCG